MGLRLTHCTWLLVLRIREHFSLPSTDSHSRDIAILLARMGSRIIRCNCSPPSPSSLVRMGSRIIRCTCSPPSPSSLVRMGSRITRRLYSHPLSSSHEDRPVNGELDIAIMQVRMGLRITRCTYSHFYRVLMKTESITRKLTLQKM